MKHFFNKEQKVLSRDALLQKEELEVVQVDLGANECVFVRQMTGRERDRWERSLFREVKNDKGEVKSERAIDDFRAKLVVHCICDEEGKTLLQPEDYETLSQNMSARRLEKIINVAQKLNKISEEDKESLIKNSEAGLAGSSISDSVES